MRINVPAWAESHFWKEPPAGHWEFWAFRQRPACEVGDGLEFYIRGRLVARAQVAAIEAPGQSECEGTGRFKDRWKVFWRPE